MRYFGENNYEKVEVQIEEDLSMDENKPRVSSGVYIFFGKVLCSYLKNVEGDTKYVDWLYNNYLEEKSQKNDNGMWAADDGLLSARAFRIVNDCKMHKQVLQDCEPYVFCIGTNGEIPTRGFMHASGDTIRDQLHLLVLLRKFEGFNAQSTRDRSAYILGYTPKVEWRESSFIDLVYIAKCIFKEAKQKIQGVNDAEDWWTDLYHALYLYNIEENNKEDYKQIVRNNLKKILDNRRFGLYGDGDYIVELALEYPEVFEGVLEGNIQEKKVKTKLEDFNKIVLSSPLSKEEETILKTKKKEGALNYGYGEKPSKLKKIKEVIENLVITMHNEKDIENEFIEEFNKDKDMFLYYKFQRYCNILYNQTVFSRLLDLKDESNLSMEKLHSLVEENEEYLYKNNKMLWLGYGYYNLAILEKSKGWEEQDYNEELFIRYLEKAKFYLAGDSKDMELEYHDFCESVDFDELPDSYIYNAYAHLVTGEINDFKSSIFVAGVDLGEWDLVKTMTLEGLVVGNANVKKLIKSGDELITIHQIRGEKVKGINGKLNLIKKLNSYITGKDKDKGKIALDKVRDKIYKEISSVDDLVELIPILLSTEM